MRVVQIFQGSRIIGGSPRLWLFSGHVESGLHVCWHGNNPHIYWFATWTWNGFGSFEDTDSFGSFWLQIFRKEPFFYGHDNYDQLVKIAKVKTLTFADMPFCTYTSANSSWALSGLDCNELIANFPGLRIHTRVLVMFLWLLFSLALCLWCLLVSKSHL